MPTRIGIWFNPAHTAYGGPAQVLIGTLMGFLQSPDPPLILLNSPGDLNWLIDTPASWVDFDLGTRGLKRALGPLLFSAADVHTTDPNTSPVWQIGEKQLTLYLAPSTWFGSWISRGMPFYDLAHRRPLMIWGAGVNTDFFRPSGPKIHSFFIYFKSQRWSELAKVHEYMFRNYFRMHGPTLVYYFYSHEELLAAATGAEFCIYMGSVETQGLAALEIMACGCPLFVLDMKEFSHEGLATQQATSVCCWDTRCGIKSSLTSMTEDFPRFLQGLKSYTPRAFVEEQYSWKAAAGTLRKAMETLP